MIRETKAQILERVENLKIDNYNQRSKIHHLEEEIDVLKKELKHRDDLLLERDCQIYFLAWMLTREGVHLESYWVNFRGILNQLWIKIEVKDSTPENN